MRPRYAARARLAGARGSDPYTDRVSSSPSSRPRRDPRAVRRGRIVLGAIAAAILIAVVAALALLAPRPSSSAKPGHSSSPHASASDSGTPSAPATPSQTPTPSTPAFDAAAKSIDDPASDWVVVNKIRPLNPKDYAPPLQAIHVGGAGGALRMRPEAATAVDAMAAQFRAETGQGLNSQSDYRPYASQVRVYNGWVASKGQAQADLQSARPGYSEHQTGLAIDFVGTTGGCGLAACFADTTAGSWLAKNAYKWGFILRYPEGKTAVTGYEFEPWHYRYVGVDLATEMHDTGVSTLEEFFHLPAAPDYAS